VQHRQLGDTGLSVPPLCIGTYTLAGAWGGDLDSGVAAMQAAFDEGLTFFDTARAYGRAESTLARALADPLAQHRDELVICSKGGFQLVDRPGAATPFMPNSRPDYLRECLEKTLQRLGTDYLDVFLIHWYDPDVPVEDVAGTVGEFVAEGLVRHVGVSNYTVEQMRRFAAVTTLGVAQVPYSLFSRHVEQEIIPFLVANGTGIMGYAALAQGYLTGGFSADHVFADNDFRARSVDFQGERFRSRVAAGRELAEVAASHGCSLAELAIAWVLANPAGVVPLVGAQAPAHVTSGMKALDIVLAAGDVKRMTDIVSAAPEMDFEGLVQ
jgi:aryl-alcohol dehydrogenase-like predicted oxidoreductase